MKNRAQLRTIINKNTGHKRNIGKYRTATKIQEFTGALGSLESAVHTPHQD